MLKRCLFALAGAVAVGLGFTEATATSTLFSGGSIFESQLITFLSILIFSIPK